MTYYDRAGRPISAEAGSELIGNVDARRVAQTTVHVGGRDVLVSTVHIVIDHNFGAGPPLIFETMCFDDDGAINDWTRRYSTEAQAMAGHDQIVAHLRAEK